jgi:hypothetical protein
MSIKSFITKLWSAIRSLFNSFPEELKSAVQIGIAVTENIKHFVDSPLADILTTIIPGKIDDKIKDALRAGLPAILTNLRLADNCGELHNPQEITNCAIKVLQGLEDKTQSAFLHSISVLVARVAADGKLSWSDGVCILEWYYQKKYKVK